jgi:RNA polymerase sigma factor (sigma-70 family)
MYSDLFRKPALGFLDGNEDGDVARIARSGDPAADLLVRDHGPSEDSAPMASPVELSPGSIQAISDQVLIEAVVAGDTSQFEQLVLRYSSRIYRFLLRNVGYAGIAEDLAQETFVEAYRHLATFKAEAKFSTWLFGIALNRLRNHLSRSPDCRYDRRSAEVLYPTIASEGNPIHSLEKKQGLLVLQQAITGLPTVLREVVILVALEELSYEEAAHIIGVPIGTVKSRMHKARSVLRESIAAVLER